MADLVTVSSDLMDRPVGAAHTLLREARMLRQEARTLDEEARVCLQRGDFSSYYELRHHCIELRQAALRLVHLAVFGPG